MSGAKKTVSAASIAIVSEPSSQDETIATQNVLDPCAPQDPTRIRCTNLLPDGAETPFKEDDLTPGKSGSAALLFTPGNWQFSTMYYYAYRVNENKFSRLDTRVARKFPVFSSDVTVSGVVQHYFYQYSDLFRDNLYDGSNRVYLSVDMTF